ncbi:MAG: tetratricopeptide repeat protein [Alphaproteobacteria bacterium]|nr:tetratricopeptide repeat protein [Alphaproteobacteria bacterium]
MRGGFANADEALVWLDQLGNVPDAEIDIFEGALALSCINHPGVNLDKYRNHRLRLVEDVKAQHAQMLADGSDDVMDTKIAALAEVFTRKHGYIGDDFRYNDLQNADLMRVIDRRLGLPITLSILCITIGRDLSWPIVGVNFPAHFVVRMDEGGVRQIIDPFQGCITLAAPELREILKKTMGPKAELSATYYEPATNRDTLVRLQNNIKHRQIEAEDYQGALATVEIMKRFAPQEYRLDWDAGVLMARLERPAAAIEALERYVSKVPDARDRRDAAMLLQELKSRLN